MCKATAAAAAILLSLSLPVWIQPAQADVVYTEVLRGPRPARGVDLPVKSQVYLNHSALRREVQSPEDAAPPGRYLPSTPDGSAYPRLEILRLDQGMMWTKLGPGRLDRQSLRDDADIEPKARLSHMADLANLEIISSRPVLRRTGLKKNVNDHMCDHIFATITCEARDKTTGEAGTLILMNDLWVARDIPQAAEIREFRRSLGRLYGIEDYFCPDAALFAEALPEQARQMGELMASVNGLPVSSTMTAKFKKKADGETVSSELLYSLTTDLIDIESIAHSPNIYELPQ